MMSLLFVQMQHLGLSLEFTESRVRYVS